MYLTINWELPLFKWIMALSWEVGILFNMAEFAFALMLMESSLAIKKAFNNERLTKSCCNQLWYCCMNLTISNLNANTFDWLRQIACATIQEAQLDSCEVRHLARPANREAQLDSCELGHLACAEMTFDIQSTDATTNWNVEEDLLSKDLLELPPQGKALFDLLVVAIISVIAFVSTFPDQRESQLEAKGLKYLTINQNLSFKFQFAVCKPRLADNWWYLLNASQDSLTRMNLLSASQGLLAILWWSNGNFYQKRSNHTWQSTIMGR